MGSPCLAFAPAADTEMSRRLYEDEAIPSTAPGAVPHKSRRRSATRCSSYSLDMFRFIVTGGTDHLSGQHVGYHATGATQRRRTTP